MLLVPLTNPLPICSVIWANIRWNYQHLMLSVKSTASQHGKLYTQQFFHVYCTGHVIWSSKAYDSGASHIIVHRLWSTSIYSVLETAPQDYYLISTSGLLHQQRTISI